MEYSRVIIDTSILLEYLRKSNKNKTQLLQTIEKFDNIYVSALTVFEIQAGLDEVNRKRTDNLLRFFTILPFDKDISDEAAKIYQQLKLSVQGMNMKDLLIAATARFHQLPLISLNMNDFMKVNNLTLLNLD